MVAAAVCMGFLVAVVVTPDPRTFVGLKTFRPRSRELVVVRASPGLTPVADLEVGQTVRGIMKKRFSKNGFFVDIGAERPGLLESGEIEDGFPTEETWDKYVDMCHLKDEYFDLRVLEKSEDTLYLTLRSGDLTRPARRRLPNLDDSFRDLSSDAWIESQVGGVYPYGVFVTVKHPTSGVEQMVLVRKSELTESFQDDCIRGCTARIRLFPDEEGRLCGTMKAP